MKKLSLMSGLKTILSIKAVVMNNKQALEYLKSELCFIFNTRFRYFDFEIFNLLEKKIQILQKLPDFEREIKELLAILESNKNFFLKRILSLKKNKKANSFKCL